MALKRFKLGLLYAKVCAAQTQENQKLMNHLSQDSQSDLPKSLIPKTEDCQNQFLQVSKQSSKGNYSQPKYRKRHNHTEHLPKKNDAHLRENISAVQRKPQNYILKNINDSMHMKSPTNLPKIRSKSKKCKTEASISSKSPVSYDSELEILKEKHQNRRLKQLYSEKSELYSRLYKLDEEMQKLKSFQYQIKPQNSFVASKNRWMTDGRISKGDKSKRSVINCEQFNADDQIEKSRKAINFILSIRKKQNERRLKLKQKIANSRVTANQNNKLNQKDHVSKILCPPLADPPQIYS